MKINVSECDLVGGVTVVWNEKCVGTFKNVNDTSEVITMDKEYLIIAFLF